MPLNAYQLHILRDTRAQEFIYGLKFLTLTTGAGYSALDAYRKLTWVETSTLFSGSVAFNPYSNKNDNEGGFHQSSDMIVTTSRDYRSTAQSKDVKIQYDSIKFRINRIIDCEDSNEIVLFLSRLE